MESWTDLEIKKHLMYLKQTLIPDLVESGAEATASDFNDCVLIIEFLMAEVGRQVE